MEPINFIHKKKDIEYVVILEKESWGKINNYITITDWRKSHPQEKYN